MALQVHIPVKELVFDYARSSGPGGQNVNKVNSKVYLRWNFIKSKVLNEGQKKRFAQLFKNQINEVGEVTLSSQRFRSQGRNVADCVWRLHEMVAQAQVAPKKRIATKPTKGAVLTRLSHKRRHGEIKKNRSKLRPDDY